MSVDLKVWTKEPTTVEGVRVEYGPVGSSASAPPPRHHRHIRSAVGDFPWDRWERRALTAGVGTELARIGREVMREASHHMWSAELDRECGWTDVEGADGTEGDRMITRALTNPAAAESRWQQLLDIFGKRNGRRTMPWMDYVLGEYERVRPTYEEFCAVLSALTADLLANAHLQVHSISARAKDAASLRGKLELKPGNCSDLTHLTDLAGLRVITYFPDDVDLVAELIRREFEIDSHNSIDKRKLLDPDRFGYLSLHYIISLPPSRTSRPEYSRYAGLRAEIQLRSILQHAWAEIEHDLGYKSPLAVPQHVRRRFSRLAGLLELADAEFRDLRDTIQNYESTLAHQMATNPSGVNIDQASLLVFIKVSSEVAALNDFVTAHEGSIDLEVVSPGLIDTLVNGLFILGITTMQELQTGISASR